jgi:hypothetical protein
VAIEIPLIGRKVCGNVYETVTVLPVLLLIVALFALILAEERPVNVWFAAAVSVTVAV